MNKFVISVFLAGALSLPAAAASLSSNAQTVIPSAVQQIISVDYRDLRDSQTALALRDRIMPDNIKQFESALKGVGINPDRDMEQLTFVSYRGDKGVLKSIGIAQGPFRQRDFLLKAKQRKIKPQKYLLADIYPMGSGMDMVFLDPTTILFGDVSAVKGAIDVRDNGVPSVATNEVIDDLINDIQSASVWSVLDQAGTQNMMRSALGQAGSLTNYDVVKKRLLASDYTMSFLNGVTFDLNIKTSDAVTAGTLSGLMKAGMMYRQMSGTPTEKMAMEGTTVDSSNDMVQMHFKSNDQQFQSLLKSDLFAAVSR